MSEPSMWVKLQNTNDVSVTVKRDYDFTSQSATAEYTFIIKDKDHELEFKMRDYAILDLIDMLQSIVTLGMYKNR